MKTVRSTIRSTAALYLIVAIQNIRSTVLICLNKTVRSRTENFLITQHARESANSYSLYEQNSAYEQRRDNGFLERNFAALASRHSCRSHKGLEYQFKCPIRKVHMESKSRGALIVLEGLDRCGKTSQCNRLLSYLTKLGQSVESWRFPDRNTGIGQMISSYLANESDLDDHAVHLLFSANRWEKRSYMESKLRSGTTIIVDRYSFSGVAFSAAKGLDMEWCKAPEAGLLAPDVVIYLDVSPEKASERGDYGGERYEQVEFQKKVAQSYQMLWDSTWKIVDGALPIEEVEQQMKQIVDDCVVSCKQGKPLSQLWSV